MVAKLKRARGWRKQARARPWTSTQDLVVYQRLSAAQHRWKGSRFLSWAELRIHRALGKCVWLPATIWLLQTSLADLWCCVRSALPIYQEHIPDWEQNLFRVRINFNIIFAPLQMGLDHVTQTPQDTQFSLRLQNHGIIGTYRHTWLSTSNKPEKIQHTNYQLSWRTHLFTLQISSPWRF